jgi:hypothetical protein
LEKKHFIVEPQAVRPAYLKVTQARPAWGFKFE